MPNSSEPAPGSVEAQALAELAKEGHVIEGKEPAPAPEALKPVEPPKEEPKKEDPQKVDDQPKPEDKKPNRAPTMVEAWKLKVAEDQKAGLEKELAEWKAKVDEVSKQKAPITPEQSADLKDEIARIAKDKDVDVEFLTGFADTILKKAEAKYRPNLEIEKTVKKLQEERELQEQLNEFSGEFDRDVLPLLDGYQLSGEALSQVKNALRDYAFSETYARVPLKEIFTLKQSEFKLSEPKKSSEGKAVKARTNADVIDIDNMTEEDFAKLPPEKVEEFMQKRASSVWKNSA